MKLSVSKRYDKGLSYLKKNDAPFKDLTKLLQYDILYMVYFYLKN